MHINRGSSASLYGKVQETFFFFFCTCVYKVLLTKKNVKRNVRNFLISGFVSFKGPKLSNIFFEGAILKMYFFEGAILRKPFSEVFW